MKTKTLRKNKVNVVTLGCSKNLYDYYLELSKLLFKKMKPGAYFLSFSSPRLYHAIAMSCEIAGFEIRDMINWTYTQSMPKGMSVAHIIEKMNLTDEEKAIWDAFIVMIENRYNANDVISTEFAAVTQRLVELQAMIGQNQQV